MRGIFVAVILAGLGLGFGYPWYVENLSGEPMGSFPLFRPDTGFMQASASLSAKQSPVRVFVDLIAREWDQQVGASIALMLTVSSAGKTMFASPVYFSAPAVKSQSEDLSDPGNSGQGVQLPNPVFRNHAADLLIAQPGEYRFAINPIGSSTMLPRKVDIVLRSKAEQPDPRVQPAGFAVLTFGVMGLLFHGLRKWRQSAVAMPKPQEKEKLKWGRDAG